MTSLRTTEERLSPFRRATPPVTPKPGNLFVRMCIAHAAAELSQGNAVAADIARDRWPGDHALPMVVERAASVPADNITSGWAAELAHQVVADTLTVLSGCSAGARVLQRSLTLTLNRVGAMAVPALASSASAASFVAPGAPIPVHKLTVSNPAVLIPREVITIAVLTREMLQGSNAEALVSDTLSRSIGGQLDAILFDANASDNSRPAGLRYNIATGTASTNTDPEQAFLDDLAVLLDAVEPVSSCEPVIFVAKLSRALKMDVRFYRDLDKAITLASSVAAMANRLVCIVPAAVAAAIGDAPTVETSIAATLHMDDAPGPISGSSPVRSLWQTDAVALKVRLPVTWSLRDPRGVAWLTPSGW